MAKGLFIVVSAPSGTGKSSICQRFMQSCPEIKFSVSYTSRPPRPNEVNGKDYYFISREEFQVRIDQGEFVEWVENYGWVSPEWSGFIAGYRTSGCQKSKTNV